MPRFKLTLEYDGGPFVGWQHQANGLSVQEVLETAIFRFCGEQVRVQAAGRTDSGVHALGQVAHADLEKEADTDTVRDALNHHMKPHPVAVIAAEMVPETFEARFSATGRAYLYRILDRRAPPVLDRGRVWHVRSRLDAEGDAGGRRGALVGRHDFTSFRRQGVPGAQPGQDPRPPGREPHRRRDPLDRRGAVLPAPPGAQHGRHARPCRPGKMDPRRRWSARWPSATGPPPAPPPRPQGLYLTGVRYDRDAPRAPQQSP